MLFEHLIYTIECKNKFFTDVDFVLGFSLQYVFDAG